MPFGSSARFNGGTITRPLSIVDPDPLDTQIDIIPAVGASAARTTLIAVENETFNVMWLVTADGGVYVTQNGVFVIGNHAAPADAFLFAGDCALWFDQTPGASKLMIKAKDSGGTVRTASIALA
jgi:hypothetical protein